MENTTGKVVNQRIKPADRSFAVFQDWNTNRGNTKGQIVLMLYRFASLIRSNKILIVLFFWYMLFYRFFVEWILTVELHWNSTIGRDLRLEHGQGTIVHGDAIIGNNCTLRHLTSIGVIKQSDGSFSAPPIIGNNVDIGVNATIVGDIVIGDNVLIGAASVVTRDVPSNCVLVGNPARVIKRLDEKDPATENNL